MERKEEIDRKKNQESALVDGLIVDGSTTRVLH
jgi:hypothetical protein